MTLNLTLLSTTYVMQVSDRRLTDLLSGGEFDALANKNVIYMARDGLFTICYSGPAYLEGVTTDTWIACKLAGKETAPFREGHGPGFEMRSLSTVPWLDIGQAVELLRRECEGLNLGSELTIGIAGWQKCRRIMRPVILAIEAIGHTATIKTPLSRYWHFQRSPQNERIFYLAEIPDGLTRLEFYKLLALLRREVTSAEAAVRRLIWAVRYAANKTPAVGPHCMCILLPNPDVRQELFVRYDPVTEWQATITRGKNKVKVPAAFMPWYVGPTIHAPPRVVLGGGMSFSLGNIHVVEMTPPVPRDTGFLGGWTTQRRPKSPS